MVRSEEGRLEGRLFYLRMRRFFNFLCILNGERLSWKGSE